MPMNNDTPIVTATVVETPRPERPDLFIPLACEGNAWWTYGCNLTKAEAESEVGDKDRALIVVVPGTRAAAAGDAVAELCQYGSPMFGIHLGDGYWCKLRGNDSTMRTGPDPQSAARACLEAIKAGPGKAGG